jgi:predicted dehydrogenase
MKTYGVGLVSFGMSGQVFHAPLVKVHPGFKLVSILERSKELSADLYPESIIVRTFEELLKVEGTDLIIVNVPDPLHYEMTREALLAGKNVIVEKPFVRDSSQGKELIDLAAGKGLLLSVFQNRRWDGDFLTVKKILGEGLLGRLVDYEAHFDRYRNMIQDNTWKEESGAGSTIYNLGSHLIDQALDLFGKPEHVYADIDIMREGGQVDDAFRILLGYEGIRVCLQSSYLVREPGPRYGLHGTLGSYLKYGIDPQEDALKKGELPDGRDWGKEPESEWGILHTENFNGKYETLPGNYTEYFRDIYEALQTGNQPIVTGEQANLVIRVIEAALESNESGKRIYLD